MHKPLNIAHRGARAYEPENTIEAFSKALSLGANGIELDIQMTSDGKLIVLHDTELADGSIVAHKTFDEIKAIIKQTHNYEICSFPEVFTLFSDRCFWDIELKDVACAQALADYLQPHSDREDIIVSSFLPQALERFRQYNKKLQIAPIYDTQCSDPVSELKKFNTDIIIHSFEDITENYIKLLHDNNKSLYVWTVNKEKDMRQFIAWGIDGIVTDYPDRLAGLLN